MFKTKLSKTLQKFNKEELKLFRQFLQSPIYNSSEYCLQLVEYYKKISKDKSNAKHDKKHLYSNLYPDEPYNDNRLRQILHKCNVCAEQFLVYLRSNRLEEYYRLLIAELYRQNNWIKLEKLLPKRISVLERKKVKSQGDYHKLYYYYDLYSNAPILDKEKKVEYNEKASIYLDKYYILVKLKVFIINLSSQEASNSNEIIEYILPRLDQAKYKNDYLIRMNKKVVQLYLKGDDAIFYKLKNMVLTYIDEIPFDDFEDIFTQLLNYREEKHQADVTAKHYINEGLELAKHYFERHRKNRKKLIQGDKFIGFFNFALTKSDLETADKILREYSDYIVESDTADVKNFCQAQLAFKKENYTDAYNHIENIEASQYYTHTTRALRLCLLFKISGQDKSYANLLKHELKSFKVFVKRMVRKTAKNYDAYENFSKGISKLMKARLLRRRYHQKLKALHLEVNELDPLHLKNWFDKEFNSYY